MTIIRKKSRQMLTAIQESSPLTWVLAGFALTYLLFFIRPLFFSAPAMRNPEPLPIHETIGLDLEQMLSYSRAWLVDKGTPYIGNNLYPPLAVMLFSPLLYLNFAAAYRLITVLTVSSFIFAIYLLSKDVKLQAYKQTVMLLILASGLVSYGLQFEIERGQFGVISYALYFYSLWLFHHLPKRRLWAYVLFTLAVQIKITPLFFMLLLVDDWRDWKANLTRFGYLLAANFALLFVLGVGIFADFLQALTSQTLEPYIWNGNHSVHSFSILLKYYARVNDWRIIDKNIPLMEAVLILLVIACIGLVLLRAYQKNTGGISSSLLLACTLGTLMLPTLSHDYKLPLLAAPVALWFTSHQVPERQTPVSTRILRLELLLLFSIAYSSTLYSYAYKPMAFGNNLPALMVMLLCITLYEYAQGQHPKEKQLVDDKMTAVVG